MDAYIASSIDPVIIPKRPLPPSDANIKPASADPIGGAIAPMNLDSATIGSGTVSTMSLQHMQLAEEINRKLAKAARGETDLDMCFLNTAPPPARTAPSARSAPSQAQAPARRELGGGDHSRGGGDPLVFDLNSDGDTNATVDQHGIDVDGLKASKWAEKGDGVLAFGDEPLDTEGGKYKDAYENLRDKAAQAGIDTSKGYLDKADLEKLEAQGLTMMVSNGDGTNQAMKPTELGISQMSLGGKAVDLKDTAGNRITEQGSFVRGGKTELVNDMWFKEI